MNVAADSIKENKKPSRKYIEDLDVLDFKGMRNPHAFDEAGQKLETYITTHYGRNGHIFRNFSEFEFTHLPEYDPNQFRKANDPAGILKQAYLEEMKNRNKKVNEYNDNKPKIYAIIWSHCTNTLQHKIRESEAFVDFDTLKEPLPLCQRIQEILLTGAGLLQNQTKIRLEA
jgi:hypothetical protein